MKGKQGFGSMSRERQLEIARMGGRAVPAHKRSFSNPDLAREAGRKGGRAVRAEHRTFSKNRELAVEAGRKGGRAAPDDRRSYSTNRELARESGRKGGLASHRCKCGNPGAAPHSCPYKSDVNDDSNTLCNCCDACEQNCRDDI